MIVDASRTPVDDPAARRQALTAINTDDLLTAFGLGDARHGRSVLRFLCRAQARRLAREVMAFDEAVGACGLAQGSAKLLRRFVAATTVIGQERLPPSGPLLIAANHPGLADTLALFMAITREDLRTIAADRPFLHALRETERYLYLARDAPGSRSHVLRRAARHLRAGGAVLTFPAGSIEPDPAVLPGAGASLATWSTSLGLVGCLVPDLTIVPAIVSGVLSAKALRNPLTLIRRQRRDREVLAAALQILLKRYQDVHVRVEFGAPIDVRAVAGGPSAVANRVVAEAARLLEQVAARPGAR